MQENRSSPFQLLGLAFITHFFVGLPAAFAISIFYKNNLGAGAPSVAELHGAIGFISVPLVIATFIAERHFERLLADTVARYLVRLCLLVAAVLFAYAIAIH